MRFLIITDETSFFPYICESRADVKFLSDSSKSSHYFLLLFIGSINMKFELSVWKMKADFSIQPSWKVCNFYVSLLCNSWKLQAVS